MNCEELTILTKTHIENTNQRFLQVENRTTNLEENMKNKVSYKIFFWVFGVMLTILLALLGYISTKIDSIQQTTYLTGNRVASIQAVFENAGLKIGK